MNPKVVAALVCLVFAFIGEAVDERLLFGTLEWLVASIAFSVLPLDYTVGGPRGQR